MVESRAIIGFKRSREQQRARRKALEQKRKLGPGARIRVLRTSEGKLAFQAVKDVDLPTEEAKRVSRLSREEAEEEFERIREEERQRAIEEREEQFRADKPTITQPITRAPIIDQRYVGERTVMPSSVQRPQFSLPGQEQRTFGTIEPAPDPTGVRNMFLSSLSDAANRLEFRAQYREESPIKQQAFQFGSAGLRTLSVPATIVLKPVESVKSTAGGVKQLIVEPRETFGKLGVAALERPSAVVGDIGGMALTGRLIPPASRLVSRTATKLSPKYSPLIEGQVKVPSSTGLQTIKVTELGWKQLREPIPKQVSLAGKEAFPVSGQRGLFGVEFSRLKGGKTVRQKIGREIIVEKPKPSPKASELERTFFADPYGRVRTKRLGLTESTREASLVDILSGEKLTFKRLKPQTVFFKQQLVQPFPKSLKGIETKLKLGKQLTPAERVRLEQWQITPSGQFKPLGKVSTEPEIILAPGEIIRKKGTRGVSVIKKRRVPFIEAEIIQASPLTKRLLKKKKRTPKEEKLLTKRLEKETGFKSVSRRVYSGKRVSPSRGLSVLRTGKISGLPRISSSSPSFSKISRAISGTSPLRTPSSTLRIGRISRGTSVLSRRITRGSGTRRGFDRRPFTPRVPFVPLLPPSEKFGRVKPLKLKKRIARELRYQPSIVAVEYGIKGPTKKLEKELLSGLEIRKIPV